MLILGRVGLSRFTCRVGFGRVKKINPRPTLIQHFRLKFGSTAQAVVGPSVRRLFVVRPVVISQKLTKVDP